MDNFYGIFFLRDLHTIKNSPFDRTTFGENEIHTFGMRNDDFRILYDN